MVRICTLTTCFNRSNKTLAALESLHNQKCNAAFELSHYIVDDDSNDGTKLSVSRSFPNVKIFSGTGDLFWAGGMRFGFEKLFKSESFDFFFFYNDDIILFEDAISNLISTYNKFVVDYVNTHALITGNFISKNGGYLTYGGLIQKYKWNPMHFKILKPKGHYGIAQTCNWNGVLIPSDCLNKYGFLSKIFTHSGADIEYGLRIRKNKGFVVVSPFILGFCERNNYATKNFKNCLSNILSIKGKPIKEYYFLYKNYGGNFWFIYLLLSYLVSLIKCIYK